MSVLHTFDGKRGLLDLTLCEAANAFRSGETTATALTKASLIAFEAKQRSASRSGVVKTYGIGCFENY